MKRRRDLGPKKIRNRQALRRYGLFAVLAAAAGGLSAWLAHWLLGRFLPEPDPEQKALFLVHQLPGMLLIVGGLVALGLLFWGIRAYFLGHKSRRPLQSSRRKLKRSGTS
ncbi:MAG: hypothetical protein JW810_03595 [Sedimentisphaerales bacterium]|nr:hypothetical protein [Sedimentisphaerales bacterium]